MDRSTPSRFEKVCDRFQEILYGRIWPVVVVGGVLMGIIDGNDAAAAKRERCMQDLRMAARSIAAGDTNPVRIDRDGYGHTVAVVPLNHCD